MTDFIIDNYFLIKALHIISIISWMAGLLYLPRLFVYHCQAQPNEEADKMLQTMERKLLRFIMNPAMIASFIFGIALLIANPALAKGGWLHVKFVAIFALAASHGMMAVYRKKFAAGTNTKSEKFYRYFNEVPTILMIAIVILAVVKPF